MRTILLSFAALAAASLPQQDPKPAEPVPDAGPVIGQTAPSFRLNDHAGRAVEVPGRDGDWTILAFYPKAATPG